MSRLSDWFDQRTGYRGIVNAALFEPIPGGARWRYVWGSCLLFVFALTRSTQVGWSSLETIIELIASAVLMLAFFVIESRSSSPLGSTKASRPPSGEVK